MILPMVPRFKHHPTTLNRLQGFTLHIVMRGEMDHATAGARSIDLLLPWICLEEDLLVSG